MIAAAPEQLQAKSLEEILEAIGSIPAERIASFPPPGTATEEDLFLRPDGEKHLYELVDGVLVEKPMGYFESRLASVLNHFLESFIDEYDLGIVLGADATIRFAIRLIRLPDVSFISWDQFPGRILPPKPILNVIPDLAVEILNVSNTKREMDRKLSEYLKAGVRLIWYVYPDTRTVQVYTGNGDLTVLNEADTLDGGDVLPGFRLPTQGWFTRAGQRGV